SSRRRPTRSKRDWSSDVCSSDLTRGGRRKTPAPDSICHKPLAWAFVLRPTSSPSPLAGEGRGRGNACVFHSPHPDPPPQGGRERSEERRVGKEGRRGWWREQHIN